MPKKPANKPTEEELKKKMDDALIEAESPSPSKPPEETPTPSPSAPVPSPSPSKPPEEPVESPSPSPAPIQVKKDGQKDDVDYRKKFVESQRETLIVVAKNKKINEAVETAIDLPDPTEEELRVKYPQWDDMTETEKTLAKDAFISTRRFSAFAEATNEFKKLDKWAEDVDTFVADPKTLIQYPALEGKMDDFKIFVLKPTRRNVDFPDLIAAFLYDASAQRKPNRSKMFEAGSGGPNTKPQAKPGMISIDEAAVLMKTDYNKYKQLLKDGKIDFSKVS